MGGTGAPGGGYGDQRVHRLARVGRERRDVDEARDALVAACFVDHDAAVGMADESAVDEDDILYIGHG
jgi:hypothetical protein